MLWEVVSNQQSAIRQPKFEVYLRIAWLLFLAKWQLPMANCP
jgi:hypothetical protein